MRRDAMNTNVGRAKTPLPANWREIRAEVMERADGKCERCKVPNGSTVVRGAGADADTYMLDEEGQVYDASSGELLGRCRMSDYEVGRISRVALTVIRLDREDDDFGPTNLKALCQRCRLTHAAPQHTAAAARARRSRKAMADLFDEPL